MAHEPQEAGKRVVLIEQGPFVVWGSMDTMSYPKLMFQDDLATTSNDAILVRSGQAVGGGTTVNIDLAFSPLEATNQARIANWIEQGLIDGEFYTQERIAAAYQWVRNAIGTPEVTQTNSTATTALWAGGGRLRGRPVPLSPQPLPAGPLPSPVTHKRDAARHSCSRRWRTGRTP